MSSNVLSFAAPFSLLERIAQAWSEMTASIQARRDQRILVDTIVVMGV